MASGLRPVVLGRSQLGMTILEVLVSLTLAGIFFAVALPAIAQAYARFKLADAQGRALALALSKADEVLSMPTDGVSALEGRVDGFSWHVVREELSDPLSPQGERSHRLRNYRISVVQSGQEILASISIQRLER
jgi:prepilin-type N-terminal cleavage/methylation domain-containing protein